MIEDILKDYSNAYGLKYIALRYFNAAGCDPDSKIGELHEPETHLIPLILDAAIGKRRNIKIFGTDYKTPDGSCVRDYIHVSDLADAHIKALEYLFKGGKSDYFNLGNGKGFSVKEVIETARKITGKKIIQSTAVDISRQKFAIEQLDKRENILNLIAEAATDFMLTTNLNKSINKLITNLGKITSVSRAYIFEIHTDKNDVVYANQKFEWTNTDISVEINNTELQNIPLIKAGYKRWLDQLSNGQIVEGLVENFPDAEKEILKAQNILSIIILPIFIKTKLWGFIGFDSCDKIRNWGDLEKDALRTAANLIGGAINRLQMEKELQQREEKLNEAYKIAGLGHFEYNILYDKLEFSQGIYDIFETGPQKFGRSFKDLLDRIHSADVKEFKFKYEQSLISKKYESMVFRIYTGGNQIKKLWTKWKIIYDKSGLPIRVKGFAIDITLRMESEDRILKLTQAVEHSPTIVFITDSEQKIEYVNKKFTEVTGYTFDEVKGRKPSLWASGYHDSKFYDDMLDTIYSGKEWMGEFRNKKKNGALFWQSTSISSPLVAILKPITGLACVRVISNRSKLVVNVIAV